MTSAPLPLRALAADLMLAIVRLTRQLRGERVSTEVTLTQLSALSALKREGGMTPGALAASERVQPPSMTRVIATLTAAGLVERTDHPTDRRQVIINLSESGAELLAGERTAREAWMTERLAALRPEQLEVLRSAVVILNEIGGQRARVNAP